MDQEYEYHYADFAYTLVAKIIDQARTDMMRPGACLEAVEPTHRVSKCARHFLEWLEDYRVEHPKADHIEIAMEVLSR